MPAAEEVVDHGVQAPVAVFGACQQRQVALCARPFFLRQRAEDALCEQEKVAHMHARCFGQRQATFHLVVATRRVTTLPIDDGRVAEPHQPHQRGQVFAGLHLGIEGVVQGAATGKVARPPQPVDEQLRRGHDAAAGVGRLLHTQGRGLCVVANARVFGAAVHQRRQRVGGGAQMPVARRGAQRGFQQLQLVHQFGQALHGAPLHHIAGHFAAPGAVGAFGITARHHAGAAVGEQGARVFGCAGQQGFGAP